MAEATYSAEKFLANQMIKLHDFDPDVTTAVAIEWRPIKEFRRFVAGLVRTIGTGATTFDIAAATDSSGTGALAVKSHGIGSEPDAVEDQLFLEVDAAQIHETLATATHWSARISVATETDEMVVVTIESEALYPRTGLTADIVA